MSHKPAPVPLLCKPVTLPVVFSTASDACVLFRFTRNLSANLGAVITAVVARSACADDAVRLLGLNSSRELFRVAARYKVELPWSAKRGCK